MIHLQYLSSIMRKPNVHTTYFLLNPFEEQFYQLEQHFVNFTWKGREGILLFFSGHVASIKTTELCYLKGAVDGIETLFTRTTGQSKVQCFYMVSFVLGL